MEKKLNFKAGRNIAMKIPEHTFDATVKFFTEILGFEREDEEEENVVLKFGAQRLWLDCCPQLSQAEIWLEILCSNHAEAKAYCLDNNVVMRPNIESLPNDFKGFWVSAPNDIICLITEES